MAVFRDDDGRREYLRLLGEQSERFGVRFLAWCLMTNHVHLIAVPRREESLARAVGEAHRRYTRMVNFAEGVRGHLFQERFGSYPVQRDRHLVAAARYVELNPVRARIVHDPGEYEWSSARFHLDGRKADPLVGDRDLLGLVDDWRGLLAEGMAGGEEREIEMRLSTGRPWGTERFVGQLEDRLGRALAPQTGGWPKGRRRGPRRRAGK